MDKWLMFIGGIGAQALVAAYVYGKLAEAVSSNAKAIEAERGDRKDGFARVEKEQDEQWKEINFTGRSVEKIKGHLGINGI